MFEGHTRILYTLKDEFEVLKNYLLTDIFINGFYKLTDADVLKMVQTYTIGEGERPEQVSQNLYGTSEFYYLIMMINQMHDIHADWCLTAEQVRYFSTAKYAGDIDADAYIIDEFGNIITALLSTDSRYSNFVLATLPSQYEGKTRTITNYEYELMLNETKRTIFVPKPEFIETFVSVYRDKVANG
jgi:hypothetical protein